MKKLKEIKQIDGKLEGKQTIFKKTTLDQIWGDTGMTKYKTLDENQYFSTIHCMSKADLNEHAVKVGLLPTDNREILEKRLMREFKQYVAAYRMPAQKTKQLKVSQKTRDILAEGR